MHGESHGQRSLADYRPWRCRVSRHTCILLSAMCPCLGNLTSICLSFLSVRWILPCSLPWGENNNTRKVLTSVYNMFIAVTVSPCLNILIQTKLVSVQSLWLFSSVVAQSCPTLCDPMDCSMPGFPVHHQLLELAQTLVQPVNDAIPPSHPLSSPSPPALNLSQHQGLFQCVSSSHQVAKVLEFRLQHQSCQWIFRTDFLREWKLCGFRKNKADEVCVGYGSWCVQ